MVTLNLPHDNLTSIIQVFYCFGLLGSYPMQVMPVFEIYEKSSLYKHMPTSKTFQPLKRLTLRSFMVMLTAIGAMVVPKFGLFINLIGSFACTALAFILPVQMYNKMHEGEITSRRKFMHRVLVVFGCICGAISFVISIVEIVKAFAANDPSAAEIANPQLNTEDMTQIALNPVAPVDGAPAAPKGLN